MLPLAPPRPAPPVVTGPPQPPAPRMIVPQTGPRPVYKAPPPRIVPPPVQSASPAAGTMRPMPGRPVPGQPIFQRPRPQGAGGVERRVRRYVPGERRPMHPTRTAPAGARPLGVGPGAAASGTSSSRRSSGRTRAQARPALCSARCKRRPDEGLHAAAAHGGVE